MNDSKKNPKSPCITALLGTTIAVVASMGWPAQPCFAQNQFAENQFAQQYDASDASGSSGGFPEHTRFDANVRSLDLVVPGNSDSVHPASHQNTPDGLVGSTTEMLSSLSSSIQQQWTSNGWKEKFGDAGSFLQNIDLGRMAASLAIVLGGYFGLVWFSRQWVGDRGRVPEDVLEVLGRVPFGAKKQLQIVRLGSKLLLLIDGPEGTHPIGEITDPDEVEYLASLCPGKKKTNGARALSIAKAAMTRNASPTVNISNPSPAPVTAATAPPATPTTHAMPPANPNHLAAILQTLNGHSGNAAVFEA